MTVTYWGGGTIAMVVPDKHWVFLIEIDKVGIVFDEYTRYEYIVEYEDDQILEQISQIGRAHV